MGDAQHGSFYPSWEPHQLLADRYRVRECLRQTASCQLYRVQDVFRSEYHVALRASPKLLATPTGAAWFERHCREVLPIPPHPNVLTWKKQEKAGDVTFLIGDNLDGECWDTQINHFRLVLVKPMLDVAIRVARGPGLAAP